MERLLHTPILDWLEWEPVKITLPATMKRYTTKYNDLDIQIDISLIERQKEEWETSLNFSTYKQFIVKKNNVELLVTGNPDLLDASLAFYNKFKKWPHLD